MNFSCIYIHINIYSQCNLRVLGIYSILAPIYLHTTIYLSNVCINVIFCLFAHASLEGFGGASSPMSFSTRITENGCSPSDLTEEDLDNLRVELLKVTQLFLGCKKKSKYVLQHLLTVVATD